MTVPTRPDYVLGAHLPIQMEETPADFETAWQMARKKAREISPDAMMVSWRNAQTGEFHPDVDCGGGDDRPVWISSAEAKGADLTIDFNDGEFVFLFVGGT